MPKVLEDLIRDIKEYLGIKSECDLAFEEYEAELKIRKRIARLYRKGIKKNDMRLVKDSLERMYDMCNQRGYKCKRGNKLCATCAFGLVYEQEELADRGLAEKVETDLSRHREMEKKLHIQKHHKTA